MRWRRVQLAEFLDEGGIDIQTGPFGTQLRASDYTSEGIPVINVRNMGYGDLRPDKLEFVPSRVASRLSRHLLETHDIVFGRKGAVDRHLLVSESEAGWMQGSDCIRLRILTDELDAAFLSFVLRLPSHRQWMIAQCSNKATMASLNQDVIARISIRLPDRETQTRIASILSAYDDLIENNRRRIKLLEQAARLLYKEWFVHLRFPGHEHVTITDGVPEGWEVKTLGDVVELKRGKYITKALAINGDVPVVAGGLKPAYFHHVANVAGPVITISASGANAGFVNLYHEDIWASDCSYIDVESTDFIYYFYLLLESRQRELFGLQRGAAQPHVYPKDLIRLRFVCAPHSIVSVFEDEVSTSFGLVKNLASQNTLLASARDLLLPRLMNGEVVV